MLGFDGVSHETLYQWIWKAKRSGDPTDKDLYKHPNTVVVRPNGVTGRTTGAESKGGFLSPERPDVVEQRDRLGDIEVDLMMGKAHQSALLVLTDRTTLLTKIRKVTSRQSPANGPRPSSISFRIFLLASSKR
ncbi:MAG: hypothetical protein U5K69_23070 [Balneolaceae bacterium]|nr:hypothetical protein [Balneolaceae bacterium]